MWLIILLCWEHSDNSNSDAIGLADGQGTTAASVLLYWTGWDPSVSSSQRDLRVSARGRSTAQSVHSHERVHTRAGPSQSCHATVVAHGDTGAPQGDCGCG